MSEPTYNYIVTSYFLQHIWELRRATGVIVDCGCTFSKNRALKKINAAKLDDLGRRKKGDKETPYQHRHAVVFARYDQRVSKGEV